MKYILASASPRRKELFSKIADEFEICPSNIPETVPDGLQAEKQPEYLAKIKAEDIAKKHPEDIVVGADTSVILGDEILGKPKDRKDAKRMLNALSGKTHKVITGCAVVKNGVTESFSVTTEVTFHVLDKNDVEQYLDTDEPYDKAGSYGIQGLAMIFVKEINGDYYNVVGLPINHLKDYLT